MISQKQELYRGQSQEYLACRGRVEIYNFNHCHHGRLFEWISASDSSITGIEADTEESGQSSDANPDSGETGGKEVKEKSEKWNEKNSQSGGTGKFKKSK